MIHNKPILSGTDNPQELLYGASACCFRIYEASREELHIAGWKLAVEDLVTDHSGFVLCPDCSEKDWRWEDLY